jgi:hypothetical protein
LARKKSGGSRKGGRAKKKRAGTSRARERAKEGAPSGEAATEGTASPDDVQAEPVDEGIEAAEAEVVDLGLEDELDDEEARARIVAEALAFVAEEEAGPTQEGALSGDEASSSDVAEDQDTLAETAKGKSVEPGDAPSPEEDATEADVPRIGAEALLALSEIHAEGLASLPDEVVIDLGESSTPEERDRLLAAAFAHSEMQEAIYRVPVATGRVGRIKAGIASVILLLAAAVAVAPPGVVVPPAPPQISAEDRLRGIRLGLLLQAEQVEAYRARTQELPETLADLPFVLPNIRFVRSSERLYQLIGYTDRGEAVVYDSSVPAPAFARLRPSWVAEPDAP